MALVDRFARWLDLKRRRDAAGAWRERSLTRRDLHVARLLSARPGPRADGCDEPADTQPLIFSDEHWAWP